MYEYASAFDPWPSAFTLKPPDQGIPFDMIPAIDFLKNHGSTSLISLGCGPELNRIDNHIKLFSGCGLNHYVGIDRVPSINFDHRTAFSDSFSAASLSSEQYGGGPESFNQSVRVFPDTLVEELMGIHCRVVVCQRVLPFKHWEDVIVSMNPVLVLQEDLNGCELQDMSGPHYTRTRAGIRHFGLRPFRSLPFLPWERNLILWRRKDFYTCDADHHSWWKRLWKR